MQTPTSAAHILLRFFTLRDAMAAPGVRELFITPAELASLSAMPGTTPDVCEAGAYFSRHPELLEFLAAAYPEPPITILRGQPLPRRRRRASLVVRFQVKPEA
jgi:hypothetical protein